MFTERAVSRAAGADKYFRCSGDDLFSAGGGSEPACQRAAEKRETADRRRVLFYSLAPSE